MDVTITLVRVHAPPTFESFLEMEDWIANHHNDNDDDPNPDMIYLRVIVAALILDALKQYESDRGRALAFLARKKIEL